MHTNNVNKVQALGMPWNSITHTNIEACISIDLDVALH